MKIWVISALALLAVALVLGGCGSDVSGEAKGGVVAPRECSDGLDNDGDGFCDYVKNKNTKCNDGSIPGDADCASSEDDKEEADCVPVAEYCDGKDNNCNGDIDEGLPVECSASSDCGTDGFVGDEYCGADGNLYQDYVINSCQFPGTCTSGCVSSSQAYYRQGCPFGCADGECLNIACNSSLDCGDSGYIDVYCVNSTALHKTYVSFSCSNPATVDSSCSTNSYEFITNCEYGCTVDSCNIYWNQTNTTA